MSVHEENLDDVIASLIDVDNNDQEEKQPWAETAKAAEVRPEGMKHPVSLTARAARQIRKIREDENLDDHLFLRVAVEGGGCAGLNYKLGFDIKNSEDEELESEDIQIVVDPRHMMYLDGVVIDYPDGLDARGFTFDNPNATENCGCGSSFAI